MDLKTWRNSASWTTVLCHPVTNSTTAHTNFRDSVYWAHCLSCSILTALDGDFILIFIVIKLFVGWTGDLIIWNLNQTSFLSSKIFFNQNNSVIFIKKKTKTKLFLVKKIFELAPQFASCLGWVRSWNYSYKGCNEK